MMQSAPMPTVSVVIPTCNRSELLRAAILSLTESHAASRTHEVVVVDNGSTDGTPAMVNELQSAGHPVRSSASSERERLSLETQVCGRLGRH